RAAGECVYREARHLDLFPTIAVEIAYFSDGGSLTQEPKEVEPSLFQSTTPGRKACYPANLALDFLYKLFNEGGRAEGLFALYGIEGLATFTVRIIHLDESVDEQGAADESNQEDSIFPEQPSALPRFGRVQF